MTLPGSTSARAAISSTTLAAETPEAAQTRRVARLVAAGWTRLDDGWELNLDDPRWAIVGNRLRSTGSDFEQATYTAYRRQLDREALELRSRQLAGM